MLRRSFLATLPGIFGCTMIDATSFQTYQQALDAVPPEGGAVFFPAGVHDIGATLYAQTPGTLLVGEGPGTILRGHTQRIVELLGDDCGVFNLTFEHDHPTTWRECIRASGGGGYRFERLSFESNSLPTSTYKNRAIVCTGSPVDVTIAHCRSRRMHFQPMIHGGRRIRIHDVVIDTPQWWALDLTSQESAVGDGTVKHVLVSDVQIMDPFIGGLYLGGLAFGYGASLPARYEMVRVSGVQVAGEWRTNGIACSLVPALVMEDVTVDGLQACGGSGLDSIGVKLDVGAEESSFTRCRVDARNVADFGLGNVVRARDYPGCEVVS